MNDTAQLIVQTNSAFSFPEGVMIVPAQPGVFISDNSGKGAGASLVQKAGGVTVLATAANPAGAGDALLIF